MTTDLVSLVNGVGNTGKAHTPTSGGVAPSGGAAPAKSNDEVDGAVRTMQKLMMDLGSQLSQTDVATAALAKLKQTAPNTKVTVEYIQGLARQFGKTAAAGLGKSPIDGTWGKNTRDVLILIKTLVKELGLQDVILSEGTGPSPYKTNDDLLTLAKQNIDNLSRLFSHIGIATTVPEAQGTGSLIVDMIDASLPEEGVNNPFAHWGSRPVMVADLTNLTAFFEFTRGLMPKGDKFRCIPLIQMSSDGKEPEEKKVPSAELGDPWGRNKPTQASFDDYMQKMAREILDGSIYRLGQTAPAATAPVVPAAPAPAADDPHCVSTLEAIIDWFTDRAKQMFDPIYEAYRGKSLPSPRPDRKGKVGTMLDAQLADFYVRQMGKISDEWKDAKDAIIDLLKKRGKSPVVTSSVLRDALGGGRSGSGGRAHREGGGEDRGGRTVHQEQQKPPLSRFMSLDNFTDFRVPSLKDVKEYGGGVLPELDIGQWHGGAWTTLAQTNVKGKDNAERIANFGPWVISVRDAIREVYNSWKAYRPNDDELRIQNTWLNRWIDAINSVYGTWRTEYKEQMEKARRGL